MGKLIDMNGNEIISSAQAAPASQIAEEPVAAPEEQKPWDEEKFGPAVVPLLEITLNRPTGQISVVAVSPDSFPHEMLLGILGQIFQQMRMEIERKHALNPVIPATEADLAVIEGQMEEQGLTPEDLVR